MTPRRSQLLGLALLLPAAAAATAQQPCISELPTNSVVVTTSNPGDVLEGVAIGDFDGNLAGDAVTVASGEAAILLKPQVYDVSQLVFLPNYGRLTQVEGLATLRGAGAGGADAFVATNPDGLVLCKFDGIEFLAPNWLGGPLWADAAPLRTADLDGAHLDDIYAVSSDGQAIYILYSDGDSYGNPAAIPIAPESAWDVVALNWDVDPELELAVLTSTSLAVYDQDGTLVVAPQPFSASAGAIARVRTAATAPKDLLLWSRLALGGSNAELLALNTGTPPVPMALAFDLCPSPSPVVPWALVPGNYDEDLHDDLVLAHDAEDTLIVLKNLGVAPFFDPSDPGAYDVVEVAGPYGLPDFGQVDDGPDDILVPLEDSDEVEVFTELPYINNSELEKSYISAEIVQDDLEYAVPPAWFEGGPEEELQFTFEVPPEYQPLYNHLEMTLWLMDASSNPNIYPNAHSHHSHDLVVDDGLADPNQFISITGLPGGIYWTGGQYFFTEYRFVQLTGSKVTRASKIFMGGFTLRSSSSGAILPEEYLLFSNMWGSQASTELFFDTSSTLFPGSPPAASDGEFIGAYVPTCGELAFNGPGPNPGPLVPGTGAISYERTD